jgi:protein-L-isoaspartate(D-aspartate) O-methyltransferase
LIEAEKKFRELKLTNIVTRFADGNLGWQEQIPFDRIIFTAATKEILPNFFNQISDNGIVIAPIIKDSKQILKKYTKKRNQIIIKELSNVLFVPNLEGIKK